MFPIDYSKDLRQKLAAGTSLDRAFEELRSQGVSIFDCIVSVKKLHNCDLAEAKRIVSESETWADVQIKDFE